MYRCGVACCCACVVSVTSEGARAPFPSGRYIAKCKECMLGARSRSLPAAYAPHSLSVSACAFPTLDFSDNNGNNGEHEQPAERKGLPLAATGSVQGVPTE